MARSINLRFCKKHYGRYGQFWEFVQKYAGVYEKEIEKMASFKMKLN